MRRQFLDFHSIQYLRKFFRLLFAFYRRECLIIALLLLPLVLMKLPMPLLTGYIIDKVITKGNSAFLDFLCVGLVGFTAIYLSLGYLREYILFCIQKAMTIRIRLKLFQHVQSLPLSNIFEKETGYLAARILNDPTSLNGLFFDAFLTLVQSILTLIVGVVVIFIINWRLATLSVMVLPFFVSSNLIFIKRIKHWDNLIKEQNAIILNKLTESLSALKVIKLFQLYKNESIKFLKNMKSELTFSKKEFNLKYLVSLATGFFGALAPLVVVWYGGHEVINKNLTIGQLVAFSSLLGFLYNPATSILSINVNFQKSLVSLDRIFNILNMPSEGKIPYLRTKDRISKTPRIEFRDISFSYDGLSDALDNINLILENNEQVAILGPTGAGKSTLVNLLAFFYVPKRGSILIDNIDIKDIPINELRKYIGFVCQESFLFSTTIYDNIRLGNLKASYADVIRAARLANAYDFIQLLPNGMDTIVGEDGEYLSGGQRQLICLARVILKNPPILILDEPTSAIDSKTEELIHESMISFMKGRSTIVISHRLSTILNVHRIVILENGRISDIGSHEDLAKRNEFFRNVFFSQTKPFDSLQNRM